MKLVTLPLSAYVDEIKSLNTFSFARYGDGEWAAIFGKGKRNCDGNVYTQQLRNNLVASFIDAPNGKFQTGMQKMALRIWGRKIAHWLKKRDISRPWHNADVFHTANQKGKLYPFVELLNDMPSVIVGPEYFKELPINFTNHIVTPRRNAETENKRIVDEMVELCGGTITVCCLGPCAASIIRQVYDIIGQDCWLLDVGSLFDPYVKHGRTRRYFGNLTKEIKAKNLGRNI
jgi:hypothetical protein